MVPPSNQIVLPQPITEKAFISIMFVIRHIRMHDTILISIDVPRGHLYIFYVIKKSDHYNEERLAKINYYLFLDTLNAGNSLKAAQSTMEIRLFCKYQLFK